MSMPGIAPRELLAAETRKAIEDHSKWDSPHAFITLHWDGEKLACRTYAMIMPDVAPADYPRLMMKMAREEHERDPDEPACAYLLQIEAFGVTEPGPQATEAERIQYNADRLGRTFHQRDDAIESAIAWYADVHGRVWFAAKRRSDPDKISESFYPPGKALRGSFVNGLLAVAYATGMVSYGLPGPPSMAN
jgi:hypothetical protein